MHSDITVVIPVSPIRSHPSTEILEETVNSVRHHLPDSEIILTFDGVPMHKLVQSDKRWAIDYEEHIRRALWQADHEWHGVCPFIFDDHLHQVGMMRQVINEIGTELLLYVEQDTPLVTDVESFVLRAPESYILQGDFNVVRFHHESVIPQEHQYLMHGRWGNLICTSQWSQRPHLASRAYYRRLLNDYFSEDAKCFIEDKMHGVVANAHKEDGLQGWNQHRIGIYAPEFLDTMKFSYHLDGRAGDPKNDDEQVF